MGRRPEPVALLAPSILSADFAHLADEVNAVASAGARLVHVDVMDGHFVPSLTLGPPIVAALSRTTRSFLDCHLMVENPDTLIPAFVVAGAGSISVHVEAVAHLHRTIQLIKSHGVRAGVALNPATPVEAVDVILPDLDFVLVMSVNPGLGGQQFIPCSIDKIRTLAGRIAERGLSTTIEVDGGVVEANARELAAAGAGLLVAGSAVFGKGEASAATRRLIGAVGDAGPTPGWVP